MIPILASLVASALADPALPVLTLDQALEQASSQPTLQEQQAVAREASARADAVRGGLLPQVTLGAGWNLSTSNSVPSTGVAADPSLYSSFSGSLGATQLLWDGGGTYRSWRSARDASDAAQQDVSDTDLQVRLGVREAFFAARAARELVGVAQDTLQNEQQHLTQVEAFIQVGTRPEIDRAQAKADFANAKVALLQAENTWRLARASLDQAMGRPPGGDYDVSDEEMPVVQGEDGALDDLVARARAKRPDVASMERQKAESEDNLRSARGSISPDLSAYASAKAEAVALDHPAINWGGGLDLSWTLFAGGTVHASIDEAKAAVEVVKAESDTLDLQVRLDVAQAQADVQSALATVDASAVAQEASKERLALAQGRYTAGAGSAIELSDAQLDESKAAAQEIEAHYDLATARAKLLAALGER